MVLVLQRTCIRMLPMLTSLLSIIPLCFSFLVVPSRSLTVLRSFAFLFFESSTPHFSTQCLRNTADLDRTVEDRVDLMAVTALTVDSMAALTVDSMAALMVDSMAVFTVDHAVDRVDLHTTS